MPADVTRAFDVAGEVLPADIEAGTRKSRSNTPATHAASDADVPVVSQGDMANDDIPHLGEASFLDDQSPSSKDGSLRRRATGLETPGTPTYHDADRVCFTCTQVRCLSLTRLCHIAIVSCLAGVGETTE